MAQASNVSTVSTCTVHFDAKPDVARSGSAPRWDGGLSQESVPNGCAGHIIISDRGTINYFSTCMSTQVQYQINIAIII